VAGDWNESDHGNRESKAGLRSTSNTGVCCAGVAGDAFSAWAVEMGCIARDRVDRSAFPLMFENSRIEDSAVYLQDMLAFRFRRDH